MEEKSLRENEDLAEQIKHLSDRENAHYTDIMLLLKKIEEKVGVQVNGPAPERSVEDLYDEAKSLVIEIGKASTSYLQRSLGIGYVRAVQLMDKLEADGVIESGKGAKPREVLSKE